jgi:putative ABC transport system ATP-binding protein
MDALEVVKLANWATHKPAELSGGQRQRVTIARALVNGPAIVWGDEPTGDLDSTNAREIMDLMVKLNREHGQTFVLVTHADEVAQRTQRIIRMQDGQITSDEAIAQAQAAS